MRLFYRNGQLRIPCFSGFAWIRSSPRPSDVPGWQARGPQPQRHLRTPVQGVLVEMVLVRVEGRTAPSSVTSAWTQPRMQLLACVATSSGQYLHHHPRGDIA